MKYALLFPGQGAQHVGMGQQLYDAFAVAKEIYQQANRALGYDLAALCFEGDPQQLTRTDQCQPAIYTTSIAAWRVLASQGAWDTPAATAGLSLGEYAAMTAAGGWSIADGLQLVRIRGEAMAEASQRRPGTMTAIFGMPLERVRALCEHSGTEVANLNSPGQIVVSGTVAGIERVEALATEAGAKRVIRLEVGGAFHSSLMEPARQRMEQALQRVDVRPLTVPVVSNVTGQPTTDPAMLRANLIAQLTQPTRWMDSMHWLLQQRVTRFVELAPAKVLAGLLKRIDASTRTIMMNTPDDLNAELLTLNSER